MPLVISAPVASKAGDVNMTGAAYLTMVRSETHKLVHFRGSDEGQLFDLIADPGERKNLWNDPSARPAKQNLLNAMLEFHIESAVQTRNARRMLVAPQGADALE